MGRLAGACSFAESAIDGDSQLLIYISEVPFDLQTCLSEIVKNYGENRNTVLVISEGILKQSGQLISAKNLAYDALGRSKLGGVSCYFKGNSRTTNWYGYAFY